MAIEKIESKLNETTTILNRYDGILQEILEAVQRGNMSNILHFHVRPYSCVHKSYVKTSIFHVLFFVEPATLLAESSTQG